MLIDDVRLVGRITSYEGLAAQLRAAGQDPEVRSVLLDISSPCGEAAGMAGLAGLIRSVRQTKPVTAFVNDMAASAAYGIASAANEIVISPTSIVGSIGVVMLHADRSGELAAQGVKRTLTHSIRPHAPETRHAGRAGPEIGTRWDPSCSTRSDLRTGAKAEGMLTRSPMKLAAATPWPNASETQRETISVDNCFDKHRRPRGHDASQEARPAGWPLPCLHKATVREDRLQDRFAPSVRYGP
jgi:hypothetical protein